MASDMFLQIDGIEGESTDDQHAKWIEISSFSSGVSQEVSGAVSTGGARSTNRCDHQDFSITHVLDSSSPKIALACANGTHIPKITVQLHRATGEKAMYAEYIMENVFVTAAMPTGSFGGELPVEVVNFNYAKITWKYIPTDHLTGAAGSPVEAYWDLGTNTGA